jgi:hypothetical protein
MSDGTSIHQGDTRALTATVLDDDDVASTPTQLKMYFTPPSGSANQTVYAKTPGTGETAFSSETSNTFTADHVFDEGGKWIVVAVGSGNMAEQEPVYIDVVPVRSEYVTTV